MCNPPDRVPSRVEDLVVAYDGLENITAARFEDWVPARTLGTLSNNEGAPDVGFQRWRLFKEAFAPELVKQAIDETSGSLGRAVRSCADPFGGSGTTALTCQFLGVHPTTVEVNPFLADLIESKLDSYDFSSLSRTYLKVLRSVDDFPAKVSCGEDLPRTFIEPGVGGKFLFWADVAGRFGQYMAAISAMASCEREHRLMRALLSACVVCASNALVSGKGRRYRRGWDVRRTTPETLDAAFRNVMGMALFDIRRFSERRCRTYTLLRGDARKQVAETPHIDVAVFSPPYPNSFDYTDVYNMELWMGGYLSTRQDNRDLREQTLRSHVQIRRSFETDKTGSSLLNECYGRLCEARSKLWNKDLPEMVPAYFSDMRSVMKGLHEKLVSGGRMYVVVGDSRYANVDVPVAQILAEEAKALGMKIVSAKPMRSMRASPQQGGREELAESLLVFAR